MNRYVYLLIVIAVIFLGSIVYKIVPKSASKADLKRNATIRVEVLNGCGVDGIGMKVRNVILKKGFDVVRVDNAEQKDFEETVVLERASDDLSNAKHFAKQFRCRNIGQDIDKSLYLEVTVIVGKDYKKIFSGVEKEL